MGLGLGLAVAGCNGDAGSDNSQPSRMSGPRTLHVFAAASTTDVVQRLAASFDAARVNLTTGGSSVLARQIADGAPADVFISASREWMSYLGAAGALAAPPLLLATGGIACVTGADSPLTAQNAAEVTNAVAPGDVIAIADIGVPAGEYARAALRSAGVLDRIAPRLVGLSDARAVVRAVETGDAAAGFVYTTDAARPRLRTLFRFAADLHPPVEYFAAVMADSRNPDAAAAFVELAGDEGGVRTLEQMGFGVPERQGRAVGGSASPEAEGR
jgi:molybdate transport system substrate-binding protein